MHDYLFIYLFIFVFLPFRVFFFLFAEGRGKSHKRRGALKHEHISLELHGSRALRQAFVAVVVRVYVGSLSGHEPPQRGIKHATFLRLLISPLLLLLFLLNFLHSIHESAALHAAS